MMTKYEIGIVAVKVLALYLVLQGLSVVPIMVSMWLPPDQWLVYLNPSGVLILGGIVLWFFASIIGRKIVAADPKTADQKAGATPQEAESLVFSCLGIIFVLDGLTGLVSMLFYKSGYESYVAENPDVAPMLPSFEGTLYGTISMEVLMVVVGCLLTLKSERIAALLARFRGAKSNN